jgi:hypothetical protein
VVPGASAIVLCFFTLNLVGTSSCLIILCGAADFLPGRKEGRIGIIGCDLIRVCAMRLPKALILRNVLFAFYISIFGHSGRCATAPKLDLYVKVLDQTKGFRPSCTRINLVACRSACDLFWLYWAPFFCPVHYARTQNVDQRCPRAILLRWSVGFARVSTCRVVLSTTLLPTNLCDTALWIK